MGMFDDEHAILRDIESVKNLDVCFIPDAMDGAVAFLAAVRDIGSWTKSERPDFYSDELRLTIEMMRVDDHPKVGKLTNPTLARETEMRREIREAFPSLGPEVRIVTIADTGLPTDDDHNFTAYRETFARVVGNHVAKVPAYRKRHPGYTLALLVHDESSAYGYVERSSDAPVSDGMTFLARAHYWFLDTFFTQIVGESGVDYFFWHTPYKHIWHLDAFGQKVKAKLPALTVYNVAAMADWNDQLDYNPGKIVSVEA